MPDALVPGLRIRVGPSGSKTFTLRTRIAGKPVNLTLGRYPTLTLARARDRARTALADIAAGRDPAARRASERRAGSASKARTLAEWWELYLIRAVRGRLRSAGEIERRGRKWILPALGHRRVETITRADVSRLVEDVAYGEPGRERLREGRHVQQVLSAFFSWALPMLDDMPGNPARDAMRPPLAPPRDRVLDDAELVAFWRACDVIGWPWGPGFQLQLLTATRRGEVFGASWAEIEGDSWTIPADRSKNGRAHFVPLSGPAMDILASLPRLEGTLIFPATRLHRAGDDPLRSRPVSGFSKAWPRLVKAMAAELGATPAPFRPHDLRRTAATRMQALGVGVTVVEAVLNHVSGTRAGIVGTYQRHAYASEKRHALARWAEELSRILDGRPGAKVLPIHRRPA